MSDKFLNINIEASRESVTRIEEGQLLYVLLTIRPQKKTSISYQPINLSLVVDRSTSMKGDRLRNVKSAASTIVEKIGPEDVISVIAFNDRAEVVSPARPVDNVAALISQIKGISASGGTEIFQGLEAGYEELRKSSLESFSNHLILMTDGHTYGDMKDCLNLARDAAVLGVDISGFGIGDEWNDTFLDKLVGVSGGQSVYIEKPSQVLRHLQNRIRGLGVVFASSLRLTADFPSSVELLSLFKVSPYAQHIVPDGLDIMLGSIEGDSKLAILLELSIEVKNADDSLQIPIKFVADIPSRQVSNYVVESTLKLPIVAHDSALDPPEQLVEAVRALNLYRMNERIWSDIDAGETKTATKRLQNLSTSLLEAGHSGLAAQVEEETERLKSGIALSPSARKQLKYGTRSLITQTMNLES